MGDGISSSGEHDQIASTESGHHRRDALIQGLGAFLLYLTLSFLFFGRGLIGHFSDRFIGRDADPTQMMWLLAWWPYALSHHLNPFLTNYVWAPVGFNFAVMTSIPLPAILATPLTLTIGVVATFNLLMLLAAPLAAVSAFALCRRITHSFWPSMLGGFVFGFSSYMLAQTLNHFCLLLVFPIPIAAYLIARWFERSISERILVTLMTAMLLAQFLMHPELFTTATVAGAVLLAVGFHYTEGETRSHLWRLSALIAASYVLTTIILIPYLYYFFAFGTLHQLFWPSERFSTDLLNLVAPTSANLIGSMKSLLSISSHFWGTIAECDGFIALPLIAIVVMWARRHWSEPFCKTLIVSGGIIVVAALGPYLQIAGRLTAPMPWLAIEHLPLLQHALPARLMLFPPLAIGLIVALWLGDPEISRRVKTGAVFFALLMMLPNHSPSFWTARVETPRFFIDGSARRNLSHADIVLTLPWGDSGQSMLWQAECGMCFRNVSGWTGVERFEVRRWPIVNYFLGSRDLPEPELQLKAFLANNRVTVIAVDEANSNAPSWKTLIRTMGVESQNNSGVSLYRISPDLLADYRTPAYSGVVMERRAFQTRFAAFVTATDEYLRAGHDPARLSYKELVDLAMLPQAWKSEPSAFSDLRVSWSNDHALFIAMGSKPVLADTIGRFRHSADVVYLPFPRIVAGTDGMSGFGIAVHNALLPPAAMPIDGESMQFLGMAFTRERLHTAAEDIARVQSRRSQLPSLGLHNGTGSATEALCN